MKFKCPKCNRVFKPTGMIASIEEVKKKSMQVSCECGCIFDGFRNIVYEPPTGGTGEVKCDCQYCQQVAQIEKLTAQHDANKNCLNCKNHIFIPADVLGCKIHHREYRKICEDWSQL